MSIIGLFFDAVESGGVYDRVYTSGDFSKYLEKIVSNGVFREPSNQLQVAASSGMNIVVKAGSGWIDGHKLINTADMTLTLDAADALLSRIDRVIFYVDYTNREMGIKVLKGTNSTNPTAPALTRNASKHEMSLATIQINKQVTAITYAQITDTRADSTVCGWVTGLLQQVDTSTLFLQWQSAYEQYYTHIKTELDAFMETLTEELRVNTYVVEYEKTEEITQAAPSYDIELDMTGYTYENTDIIRVYINGLLAEKDTDYQVTISGGTATVTVHFALAYSGVSNVVDIKAQKSVIGITNP